MPLRVTCPGCQTAYDLPDGLLGGTLVCGTCRRSFAVPAPPGGADKKAGAGRQSLLAGGVLALALMLAVAGGLAVLLLLAVLLKKPPSRPAPTAEVTVTDDQPASPEETAATDPPEAEVPPAPRAGRPAPEAGRPEPSSVPVSSTIAPRAGNWDLGQGTVQEEMGLLRVENDGGHYWLTSREPLPEDFQLTLRCGIDPLIGKQKIQLSQRNSLVALCVRWGTDETGRDVQDRNGMTFRLTPALAQLWKEGQVVARQPKGSPNGLFTLVVTRQGGDVTIAINGDVLMKHYEAQPLRGRHRFSVGGYLSRLRLGEARVMDLKDGDSGKAP